MEREVRAPLVVRVAMSGGDAWEGPMRDNETDSNEEEEWGTVDSY